ncbi:poly-gamma-glutamate hydrolase family protein, partial [Devosia sp.]|uniref:poly-gamma-glutamate hydrolase family protein n=1 Tax=Devosia sp. TaxID=1871048 RepID=UPI003263E1D5
MSSNQAPDKYGSFRALSASEVEDIDFSIALFQRNSSVAILAPHGGWIEPTTSEITAAIAADRYSLYLFEGLKQARPHSDLHITSIKFDEPKAVNLVVASATVITVHGRADGTDPYTVYVGGRDKALA